MNTEQKQLGVYLNTVGEDGEQQLFLPLVEKDTAAPPNHPVFEWAKKLVDYSVDNGTLNNLPKVFIKSKGTFFKITIEPIK